MTLQFPGDWNIVIAEGYVEHFLQWSSDGVADLGLFERDDAKFNAFGAIGIISYVKPNYGVT